MNLIQIKQSKFIRKATIILSVVIFTGITSAFTANSDFSGEWKLNESKSNLGQFGRAAKTLKIEGNVESLAVQRISTNQAGEEMTTSEKLTFDDKETESTVFGNSKKCQKPNGLMMVKNSLLNQPLLLKEMGRPWRSKPQKYGQCLKMVKHLL